MLLVIGLDCAAAGLVFGELRRHLPFLSQLRDEGSWGTLRSVVPPITVPAWACMFSGRDAGELGVYGFRDRVPGGRALCTVTSEAIRAPRVWDLAGRAGLRSSALFVPPSWPPSPVENGELVSCLLTPEPSAAFAEPPALEAELRGRFGPYLADVPRHGSDDETLAALYRAAGQHFDIAEARLEGKPDLLAMVEIGTDRLHHAMWPALDPSDPRHDPQSPRVRDARDFYAFLDGRIARLVERAGREATVLVASDHGARPLEGGLYVNEWLRRTGRLVLRSEPAGPVPLARAQVDWRRTRVWAEGGYYARLVVNRASLPDGAVAEEDVPAEVESLAADLAAIAGPEGRPLPHRVVRPAEVFRARRGTPPDLMFFPGDLRLRALGEVGGGKLYADPEEAGGQAGGCNHDWDGMFVLAGAGAGRGQVRGAGLHDVGATALAVLGLSAPPGWLGRDLRSGTGG